MCDALADARNVTVSATSAHVVRRWPNGISDVICLLKILYGGFFLVPSRSITPCGSDDLDDPSNMVVLDFNGDGTVSLTDAISIARFAFSGGAPPAAGLDCVTLVGCPDSPGCE